MNRFFLKIILPSILSILLFIITIFFIIIPQFHQNIMNGKRELIKELTNSALSILSKYEMDERNGLLTKEEAQIIAVSRIQYLRYGEENKDYFWITDMHPYMVMHPYRPDLNGKDLTQLSDPHGKKLFVEFVETVKKTEHGYVDYMWQWKDDTLNIVPKLSYVSIFKPWNWVIGTGIYIEDVKSEIKALTKKLLWISCGISLLILFLLVYISQQSLKIERERIEAENDLHNSKEKYKTLVEAATEGLIMLIDGKISLSNIIISRMTGYEAKELSHFSFHQLLSENNHPHILELFSKNSISEGQYELNLKKKNGETFEVLLKASNALLFNNNVSIIIVNDLTLERKSDKVDINYQKLINSMNLGVFKMRLDYKGTLLYANNAAIKILGGEKFNDLSNTNIFEIVEDGEERKNLRSILIKNYSVLRKVVNIRKKNGEKATVLIYLLVTNREQSTPLVCEGIIEDITAQEQSKKVNEELIILLKAGSFLLEQPIKDYISPVQLMDSDATLQQVVKRLNAKKTDSILLSKNQSDIVGIITATDIQQRILGLNLNLDNPAYLIMSSPVVYINENQLIVDALAVGEEKSIQHLVVIDNSNGIVGLLRLQDIYTALKDSISFLLFGIKKSETELELKILHKKFQQFIKPLINSELSAKYLTSLTSQISNAITVRIIELVIDDLGNAPARFAFINMGSEGRQEETLLTDQDNAIIYENVPPDKVQLVSEYFGAFAERVCNMLHAVGYTFCKGNIMAKNSQWCQPLSRWEEYFTNWISTPEPQNLLDAEIFFDFRNIYGALELTEKLRELINLQIINNQQFIYLQAYNTCHIRIHQISSGTIISDKSTEVVDLKEAISVIVLFIRTYALQHKVNETNSLQRLSLLKSKNYIHPATADEIAYVYNYLMKLRMRNQADQLELDLPLSNLLSTKKLIEMERSVLKKVLSLVPAYQTKISTDFRITT